MVGTTATTGSTSTAPSCLDSSAAVVGDCGTMRAPDPSCAFSTAAAQRCAMFRTEFDPLVAVAAVSCMTSLTSKELCDAAQTESCARSALAQACPDSTVSQLCQVAAGPCKISQSDCSGLLSGLNDQGKEGVARCVATGCNAGLYACIDGLSSALSSALH